MGPQKRRVTSAALLVLLLHPAYLASGRMDSHTTSARENDEKRLMDVLSRGYDRDVRPVFNASRAVIIKLGITLTQIFDMDEKNQVLTTNVWLDQEWEDELLTWDPRQFGGLSELRVPCHRIWLPDIVLYNNADDYTRGYMQSRAMVHSDGRVFWPPPTKFRSTCAVDVTYFPFDDQTCILKLGSWTYNGFQVDVTNRTQEVDLSNYVPNGEWELLEARINRNVVYYSCCPEPFPDVTITLIIRRKTLFYMYNIVMPCMMMSVLTLLVFCMPPESGEKISLGVTVLLAFSVFMLAIAEKMPETSDSIPLIGIYLTAVMAITSVSIVMTVVVLNLHYRGPARNMSRWIKYITLKSSGHPCRRGSSRRSHRDGRSNRRGHRGAGGPTQERLPADGSPVARSGCSKSGTVRLPLDPLQPAGGDGAEPLGELGHGLVPQSNGGPPDGPGRPARTARPQRDGEGGGSARDQWRRSAIVADRVLFWFFLVITTFSSLLFLVVLPVYKRSLYQRPD
ncbi:neuronal acetylcholine receptor subunit alpha-10-like [Amphibalanus amphitrite]|uniref:neuronal acetylcholine receptor subunit alpha-10-like n=1 Tax=Amphibalanus amphitrite TaxID=1232801 RepID=UPI001C8FB9A5|nr:neuronal acetylcholine receptor subunit alpha-10-like [Amphibalanus amphitrite]